MSDIRLDSFFEPSEIEWRVQSAGETSSGIWTLIVPYIQNRAIMDRLDSVIGPEDWQNKLEMIQGGFICGIGIKQPLSGEWIWKYDGAPQTHIEAIKGGISDSMKRAAVQWGIGRYLYRLDPVFAEVTLDTKDKLYPERAKIDGKNGVVWYRWRVPANALPSWAKPNTTPTNDAKKPENSALSTVEFIRLIDSCVNGDVYKSLYHAAGLRSRNKDDDMLIKEAFDRALIRIKEKRGDNGTTTDNQ